MKLRSLLIAAAAVLLSSAALAAPPKNPLSAQADGASGVFLAATLCSRGSFECATAPAYTKLAVARRSAAVALRKGTITVDHAQAIQVGADKVRALLDASLAACRQNDHTGRCTGDAQRANLLLAQARAGLSSLK